MAPATRQMFTRVEFWINEFRQADFSARQYQLAPANTDHMREIIAFLPNLRTLVITLPCVMAGQSKGSTARWRMQVRDTLEWVLGYVHADVEILWDLHQLAWYPVPRSWEELKLLEIVEKRGAVRMGKSV